ncbi:MAG: thioredoxin-dependent thiol peroxidase [Bacteroidetes bacterium]|nr:thioredoxin-dependent thiol peroxidase [Bacteroidota bacterium]
MSIINAGVEAPHFEGIDQNGQHVDLKSLKGSKVVLYFYPKDSTPGCTAEACDLRDNYQLLISKGYKVVGVSPDNESSHKKFADKYELPFPLLPDPDKKIIEAYGVWGPKKFLGKSYEGVLRTTFIISEDGIIEEVIGKVDTKNHTQQIIK